MSLSRITSLINRTLMVIAATWAFCLALVISFDVAGRTLFAAPLTGTNEIVGNSIAVITFMSAAYAVRSRSMLRADFLMHLISPPMERALNVLGYLAGAAFFGAIIYGALEPFEHAWTSNEFEGEGALRVPTWPIWLVLIAASALTAVNYLLMVSQALLNRPDPHSSGIVEATD